MRVSGKSWVAVLLLSAGVVAAQENELLNQLFSRMEAPPSFNLARHVLAGSLFYSDGILSQEAVQSLSKTLAGSGARAIRLDNNVKVLSQRELPHDVVTSLPEGAEGAVGVAFAVIGASGSTSKALGFAAVAKSGGIAPLVVSGPCFQRKSEVAAGKAQIFIACDPAASGDKGWQPVPLSSEMGTVKQLKAGFSTGRAGFYTEKGQRMFFVELYAWPEDPVAIGG